MLGELAIIRSRIGRLRDGRLAVGRPHFYYSYYLISNFEFLGPDLLF